MNKKSEWFRIGEVSEMFHISVGLLRHYDKIGLLKPEYTDPETGYRYYSVRQHCGQLKCFRKILEFLQP